MQPFRKLTGIAAPLAMINVDTDMLIPKQFLKTIKRSGLGSHLFDEQRYRADGSENPDFVLNKAPYRNSEILIAGDNFGCGSSREHAPWALLDFGIRCIIAPGFADIFHNNCFKNGILPIVLPQDVVDELMSKAQRGQNARFVVSLQENYIEDPDGKRIEFAVDSFRRSCLLEGWDDIALTLENEAAISRFEAGHSRDFPWILGTARQGAGR